MKLSKKESPTEDGPVLLQLQRRHTLAEMDKNVDDIRAKASKTKSRSNSVSSSDTKQNPSQATTEFQEQMSVDSTLSPEGNQTSLSTASTVVITESELSSSWLYKNKKAQMNTVSPYESTCNSSAPLAPTQEEQRTQDNSPMIPRPNKQTIRMNHRSKNVTSCCCYTTAMCIICLATLGILAAIASIIYLEIFSNRNATSNELTTEPNFSDRREIRKLDRIPIQKIGDLLNNENGTIRNGIQKPDDLKFSNEMITSNIDEVEGLISTIINETNSLGQSYIDGLQKSDDLKNSNEMITSNIDEVEGLVSTIINETNAIGESFIDRVTNHAADGLFEAIESNVNHFLNLTNTFNKGSQKDESPYSKLFQLYNDLHNTGPKNSTILKEASESEDHNVSNSRSIDLPAANNADFNQLKSMEDKPLNLVPGNDLVLKHNSDIEKNKTDDLELLFTKSFLHHDLVLEEEVEILKNNSDFEQDKTENTELLPTKSSQHDLILEEENKVPDLNNSDYEQVELEDLEHFISKSLPHDHIVEKETKGSESKDNTENDDKTDDLDPLPIKSSSHQVEDLNTENEDKTDDLDPLPIKSSSPQVEDLKTLEQAGDQMKEFKESNTQEQSLQNDTTVLGKPFEFNQPIVGANVAVPGLVELFKKSNTPEQNLQNDTSILSRLFGFSQPIVGANVAVPGPVELFRRMIMERESDVKPQVRQDDNDRRFSLAQALESLRRLDVSNQLPSSRQKPMVTRKPPVNRNNQHKMQILEDNSEKSHYLENLRKKLYDN